MNIERLSSKFAVRYLTSDDVDIIYNIFAKNKLFYKYHPPFVSRESILEDMNALPPGKGVGTEIIQECVGYLRQSGYSKIRLAIDKDNPQSEAFWTKNGFVKTGEEYPNEVSVYLPMERQL